MNLGRTVIWAERASDDLTDIVEFIAMNNEFAAMEFYEYVMDIVNSTAQRPLGRRGELAGTYERVLTRYPSWFSSSSTKRARFSESSTTSIFSFTQSQLFV